jgi:hypothetical protein
VSHPRTPALVWSLAGDHPLHGPVSYHYRQSAVTAFDRLSVARSPSSACVRTRLGGPPAPAEDTSSSVVSVWNESARRTDGHARSVRPQSVGESTRWLGSPRRERSLTLLVRLAHWLYYHLYSILLIPIIIHRTSGRYERPTTLGSRQRPAVGCPRRLTRVGAESSRWSVFPPGSDDWFRRSSTPPLVQRGAT